MFADFINPNGSAITAHHRQRLPRLGVAAWAICAESDAEALRLSLSLRMMMTLLQRGRLIAVPTVERAEQFLAEERTPAEMLPPGRRIIAGSPEVVRAAIEKLAAEYGAEEVLIVNIMHDHAARLKSYELIAKAFGIAP